MTGLEIAGYTIFAIGVALAIFFGITAFIRYILERKEDTSKTIRQPRFYVTVGGYVTICALAVIVLAMFVPSISSNTKEERFTAAILFSFMLYVGEIFGIIGTSWKIELEDDCFYFTNIFGIKKRYKYEDVNFKYVSLGYRVYKGKKYLTTMNNMQVNYDALAKAKRAFLKRDTIKDNKSSDLQEEKVEVNENKLDAQLDKAEAQNQILNVKNCGISEEIQEFEEKEETPKDKLYKTCNTAYKRACKWNKVLVSSFSWIITAVPIAAVLGVGYYFLHDNTGIGVVIVTGVLTICSKIVSSSENKKSKVLNSLNEKSKVKCFKRYRELYSDIED